jgi:hypothetical protein
MIDPLRDFDKFGGIHFSEQIYPPPGFPVILPASALSILH